MARTTWLFFFTPAPEGPRPPTYPPYSGTPESSRIMASVAQATNPNATAAGVTPTADVS